MPLSNAQSRMLSSLVLLISIAMVFVLGKWAAKIAFVICFALVLDEILVNFKHIARKSGDYFFSFAGFSAGVWAILSGKLTPYIFWGNRIYLFLMICSLIIFSNRVFVTLRASRIFNRFIRYTLFLLPLFPLYAFNYLIEQPHWRALLVLVLGIGVLSDSLGWVVGKLFGKHKLYPSVSPNKTVEGALGSTVGAGLLLASLAHYFYGLSWFYLFAGFTFLAFVGVVGDLWQSRLKRLFNIKDSSQLIPGHGGVYDRVDSHIFIAPFFVQIYLLLYPLFFFILPS